MVVEDLAICRGGGEFAPLDCQRRIIISQGHVADMAIGLCQPTLADPAANDDGAHVACACQIVHPLIQQRVRSGFADQNELESTRQQIAAIRLMAVQIVTGNRDVPGRIARPLSLQPTPRGVDFTVLFLITVLGNDELRRSGDDFVSSGTDQNRRNRRVGIGGAVPMSTR